MSDGPSWQPPGGENLPPPPPGSGWGAQPDSGAWSQSPTSGPPGSGWGQPAPSYGGEAIPNHLVWAILTTVFCCLPFGIVSIVFAAQVNGKQAAGDIAGARDASRKAKTWAIVAAVTGALGILIWLVFVVFIGVAGFLSDPFVDSFEIPG